jgi:uncharacterized tellurite resistance protein B-like protein
MAIVDTALTHGPIETPPLTVAEAIAALLVAAVAVDGVVTTEEAARIGELLTASPLLRQRANGSTRRLGEHAVALLTEHGLAAVLTGSARAIPSDLRATTFALVADVALADGRIGDREKTFIDQLQGALQIDDPTAVKILEVLLIKNRV